MSVLMPQLTHVSGRGKDADHEQGQLPALGQVRAPFQEAWSPVSCKTVPSQV